MLNKALNEPVGYKGTAISVVTTGRGTPIASPELEEVMKLSGYAPNGISLVTSPSIAVAIDDKGYLVPADGENKTPFGIIGLALRSTKHLFSNYAMKTSDTTLDNHDNITPAFANGMDDLHGITPTVYQFEALFERGIAFKTEGASKALFDLKPGDLLRPIKSTEINTAINDDTLPVLFGEDKANCPRTKGYYAGMLVKFDGANDKAEMRCARVASVTPGETFNHLVYTGNKCFDYDIQGRDTKGTSRNVWNSISSVFENKDYTKTIVEFYVNM